MQAELMPQVLCEELLTLLGTAQHGPPQEAHYPELSCPISDGN